VVAVTLALLGAAACGGATDIGDGTPGATTQTEGSGVPSFGAPVAAQPLACTACTSDRECGDRAACVVAGGGGFCAPGCTKEGFCTSDRVCRSVSGASGVAMRACLPRGGCTR